MICQQCGQECGTEAGYCSHCGAPLTECTTGTISSEQAGKPSLKAFVAGLLREPIFLVICILQSVSAGAGLIFEQQISVLSVLYVIFLWMLYAHARAGFTDTKMLRCLSGTVFASYVVSWVVAGAAALVGVMCAVFGPFLEELLFRSLWSWGWDSAGLLEELPYGNEIPLFSMIGMILLAVVFLIVAAAFVVNAIGLRAIHKLLQSSYRSVQNEAWQPVKVKAAKTWLLVLAIFGAVGSVFGGLVVGGCEAASMICAYIWLKKHVRDDGTLC